MTITQAHRQQKTYNYMKNRDLLLMPAYFTALSPSIADAMDIPIARAVLQRAVNID
ncbi:hypothetical protein ACL2XG_20110 [Sodalis sp. RH24]|uniref:hypothetical protein n=1 Tax=unclassified Sodalis (in: enterobacteria) TaxID=2636512 RepID=UPI0039B643BD